MSVIATVTVPAEEFALGDVLEVRRGIQVRLEATIPIGTANAPCFWVPSADADAVEGALRRSSLVETFRVLGRAGEETLFQAQWAEEVDGLVDAIDRSEGIVLEGFGRGDDWSFRLRFPEHDDLSAFYRSCTERGLQIGLEEMYASVGADRGTEFGLTSAQYETLVTALEAGYFDVPRRVTQTELAETLGVSDTAVSQCIRRGLTSLLSATLRDGVTGDD